MQLENIRQRVVAHCNNITNPFTPHGMMARRIYVAGGPGSI